MPFLAKCFKLNIYIFLNIYFSSFSALHEIKEIKQRYMYDNLVIIIQSCRTVSMIELHKT